VRSQLYDECYLNTTDPAASSSYRPTKLGPLPRDVANAQAGLGKLAEAAQVNRENLYRMRSADGNPRLNGLSSVLKALGFKLKIETGESLTEP
jgi:hypothetical protein